MTARSLRGLIPAVRTDIVVDGLDANDSGNVNYGTGAVLGR